MSMYMFEMCNLIFKFHVPFVYMERAEFISYTAAIHQGAIEMLCLHLSGRVRHIWLMH